MHQPPYGYPPPPPPPKKDNAGLIAVLLIIGMAAFAMIVSAAAKRSTPPAAPEVATTTTTAPSKPTATKDDDEEEAPIANATPVTAATLVSDYEGNEVRGDAKWKGRAVEVTGTVRSIDKGPFGGMYVVLEGTNPYSFHTVHVEVKKSEESRLLQIDKGEKHTFRGRVLGMTIGSVSVRDSVMLE